MCDDHRIVGTFFGIGLGPGDPDLLTVRARRLLLEADMVLVPKGCRTGGSVAQSILDAAFPASLPTRELLFPMDRDEHVLAAHWNQAAEDVAKELDAGRNIAFVTLGDVSLYSTFVHLERALRGLGDYSVVRVPGISSIQAASSRLGRELAMGSDSLAVMPLPADLTALDSALGIHETVVVMKIGSRLSELRTFLRKRNMESSSGFVRRLGLDNEVVAETMDALPEDAEGYLSLVIIRHKGDME